VNGVTASCRSVQLFNECSRILPDPEWDLEAYLTTQALHEHDQIAMYEFARMWMQRSTSTTNGRNTVTTNRMRPQVITNSGFAGDMDPLNLLPYGVGEPG